MGGGLLQLVAYGAQDVYLTGNPQITFFKVVYRRHTNFSIESIMQTINGTVGYGNTINCTISRNGDLINRVYVEFDIKGLDYDSSISTGNLYNNYLGLRLLKNVNIEIGGQQVDKHYSEWMYIWNELSLPKGKRYGYDKMVGADGVELSIVPGSSSTKLFVPLEFWFCRNIGLALPLIALQYHEVKLKINFATSKECGSKFSTAIFQNSISSLPQFKADIWVDYIYLDTDERRKFAQLSHEYLIEQLQFTGDEVYNTQLRLNFNHPSKELVWVSKLKNEDSTDVNTNSFYNWNNFTTSDKKNPFIDAHIKLNGNDRVAPRDGSYFDIVQPYQHHTNVPKNRGINVYSFAIKPEEHQPSGTLNMSRIDSTVLASNITDTNRKNANIAVYAVNYNVLRILSGMGGLAYSN